MHYSLFIDESGDFESKKSSGEWVVAGVLCATDAATANQEIGSILGTVAKRFSLEFPKDFHLTDLRHQHGIAKANEIATATFDALTKAKNEMHFLAVVNVTRQDTSDRERTYRLMLLDLLALAETVIISAEPLAKLDFVVANRTSRNNELMTTANDIQQEVVEQLPAALEVGLASRGLIQSFNTHNISLQLASARQVPGLIAADFVANLVYNQKRTDSATLINEMARRRGAGQLSIFEAFGGYEERRARIAERDGDYITALYRWAVIKPGNDKAKQAQQEAICRLCYRIIRDTGSIGPRASIEALIERFQRTNNSAHQLPTFSQLCAAIRSVETPFAEIVSTEGHQYLPLLFRLRNYLLLNLNHWGDGIEAQRVQTLQEQVLPKLMLNPDNFALILDYQALRVETAVNNLDFKLALEQAQQHQSLLSAYKICWELLNEQNSTVAAAATSTIETSFEASRTNVRAVSNVIRCQILNSVLLAQTGSVIDQATEMIARLEALAPISNSDRKRLHSYYMMGLVKRGDFGTALKVGVDYLKVVKKREGKLEAFDLLWVAHAATDAVLANRKGEDILRLARMVLEELRQMNSEVKRHPYEVLWRERGMLEWLLEDKVKEAERCYAQSKCCIELGLHKQSPVSIWLIGLLQLQFDALDSKKFNKNSSSSPTRQVGDKNCLVLAAQAASFANHSLFSAVSEELKLLAATRIISPY